LVATDALEEPMLIAKAKDYGSHTVRFELADAYALGPALGSFDAALAIFWWSHIPRSRIDAFLASLHARLEPGARVLFMDNSYVDGSSTPVAERDAEGNTYQLRRLGDGSENRVLKNFPSEAQLRADLAPHARALSYRALEYYWLVEYELK
jgi:demethylmenaquinone methyltransferase/2-methoxy-6-polyprenyl-1,4-benzoquinol methylase